MIKIVTFPKLLPMIFYVNLYIDENVLTLCTSGFKSAFIVSVSFILRERAKWKRRQIRKKNFCSLLHNIYYK